MSIVRETDGGGRDPAANRMWPLAFAGFGVVVSALILVVHVTNRGRDGLGVNDFGYAQTILCVAQTLVGALILRRHPRHVVGWIFVGVGLATGIAGLGHEWAVFNFGRDALLPAASLGLWLGDFLWLPGYALLPTLVILLFPTGRPPTRLWWPVLWVTAAFVTVDVVWMALTPYPDLPPALTGFEHPLGVTGEPRRLEDVFGWVPVLALVLVLLSAAGMVTRLLRVRGVERDQLLWFVLGTSGWLALLIAGQFFKGLQTFVGPVAATLLVIGGAAIGMLKHNLLDVRKVVNRALGFALLSAILGLVYIATISLAAARLGRGQDPIVSAIGVAAVVAAAFPLRSRVQRSIDRLLYGERSDPYAVSTRIQQQLAAAADPHVALWAVADTMARSLKLAGVRIQIRREGELVEAAGAGAELEDPLTLPLVHQGEDVGLLRVARWRGEPLRSDEVAMVEGLARQLAAAAYDLRRADELRRSREMLVLSREEERRRIRRDLHDGLGPTLAAVALQLDLARTSFGDDDPVGDVLGRLKDEVTSAITEVRGIVYDLRPPALDELGLVPALEQWVAGLGAAAAPEITLSATDCAGSLPAAVEVAVYRIVTEAVTNVLRHAGATRCEIDLRAGQSLHLEVRDDGGGLPEAYRSGVGLSSIRERVDELRGEFSIAGSARAGTRLRVEIPLEVS